MWTGCGSMLNCYLFASNNSNSNASNCRILYFSLITPRAYSGFSRDLLIIFPYVGVFSQWLLPELLMKSNKPHCIRKTIVWGSYWYKVCCLTSITKIVMPKIARKIEKKCQILRQLFRLWTVVAQCWYTILKFHGKIGICEKIPYQTV